MRWSRGGGLVSRGLEASRGEMDVIVVLQTGAFGGEGDVEVIGGDG
jgi:hypothetical protein